MYKFSVAFFVVFLSMTTFVAAAPDGIRQPAAVYFRKRTPQAGDKSLQKKVLRGAITEYCGPHHDECMKAIGTSESLQQFEDGSMGGGAPPNRAERMKLVQKAITSYCGNHHDECLAAIGRTGSLNQLEQGSV
ncbi:hypothetical protein APHAL10511_006662 [Amanita phalloides]|nr:hypothetical protein APHAL10511_006662 [Amanita phalloides]